MNSKLALAALIAATLALGACSKAPQPHAAAAPAVTTGPLDSQAGVVEIGWMGRREGKLQAGTNYWSTDTFSFSRLTGYDQLGIRKVWAFFHADDTANVLVTGAAGQVAIAVRDEDSRIPFDRLVVEDLQHPHPILVFGGWGRLSVVCISASCSDMTATIDGKPFTPFAPLTGVVATRQ